jgi:hypothetical protein
VDGRDDGGDGVVADLTERVEMLADDAQPHDENRKLVKPRKRPSSPSSPTTASMPRNRRRSRRSARRS